MRWLLTVHTVNKVDKGLLRAWLASHLTCRLSLVRPFTCGLLAPKPDSRTGSTRVCLETSACSRRETSELDTSIAKSICVDRKRGRHYWAACTWVLKQKYPSYVSGRAIYQVRSAPMACHVPYSRRPDGCVPVWVPTSKAAEASKSETSVKETSFAV
ncbi:hypothetical protein BU23DRAFT_146507 [Bimuria novae-zelandiae CBS 107.79]|uniref:Uncharacterized protein n=1 Tax=Bimuria novae-zelandiae CBS 107.79 TaxID=1447943 RepID=A0A6A5V7W7_9PLEO|nr:hypothetical protein BU23DRAFT_146507 [Bimuria novae-zelandiae CBS 107.79]